MDKLTVGDRKGKGQTYSINDVLKINTIEFEEYIGLNLIKNI